MELRIKSEYLNTAIAFGNSGIALKRRTQAELVDLALLAHSSGHKRLKDFFEYLPSENELKAMKMRLQEVK